MKKLILLLSLVMVLSVVGVVGQQGVTVTLNENNEIVITPATLDFGNIATGTDDNPANDPILFTPQPGANTDLTVAFASVDQGTLFELMELEIGGVWVLITTNPTVSLPCVLSMEPIPVCIYTPANVNARLDVPLGYPAGIHVGTIAYTISGTPPS